MSVYLLPFIVTYENNKNLTRQSLILNCTQKYKKPFEFVSISRNKFSGGRLLLIFFKINSISSVSYSRRFIYFNMVFELLSITNQMFAKIIPTLVSVSNEGNFLCIKSKGLKFVFPTVLFM